MVPELPSSCTLILLLLLHLATAVPWTTTTTSTSTTSTPITATTVNTTTGYAGHVEVPPISRECEVLGSRSVRELACRGRGLADLAELPSIENITRIDLTSNNLTKIPARAFLRFSNLEILLLRRNHLRYIDPLALDNLAKLAVLELDDNNLTEFPAAVSALRNLEELSLSNNRIRALGPDCFERTINLLSLDLRGNPIKEVHEHTFRHLSRLRRLSLSNVKELSTFPVLSDCRSLEFLRIDRARISHVPDNLCRNSPKLKSLDLKLNHLTAIPNIKDCLDLRVLDLTSNSITSLAGQPFRNSSAMHDLLISKNKIRQVPEDAFTGLSRLQLLDLESNQIEFVHPDAFTRIKQLEDLNLGNNVFPELPVRGLSDLLHLKTFNNPALREFPSPDLFPKVRTMVLSYAYHCCPFANVKPEQDSASTKFQQPIQESILFPTDNEFDLSLWNSSLTDIWPQLHNLTDKFGSRMNELWDNFGSDFTYPGNLPAYVEEYFEDQDGRTTTPRQNFPQFVNCMPLPGPFLPCEDLFDWWSLRCGVWVVFLLAMLGNGVVVFVLIFSRSKMDVPRFLVCNLAAADFFMGIYLGLLAIVDAITQGEFRKHAITWQMSYGCQLAGFLGVLSSELSVYTLAVITLERNYAITHAMHLNKRLSLRHASCIMTIGWLFALVMAALPLFGISDYRKFAICLPFETTTPLSLAYVVFLMIINGVAFFILMGCYLKMYLAIRGSQVWNSNDSRIAKRMALLVFTDFLCWSPIAFFSLTATFGLELISLEQAKVFAVFVLPLNSCCNPFLYAILTKQFKKDCVMLCKAIEETRVNKNVGVRCKYNNSNVSNRYTGASHKHNYKDRDHNYRHQNNHRRKRLNNHHHYQPQQQQQPSTAQLQQQQSQGQNNQGAYHRPECLCGNYNNARVVLQRNQTTVTTTATTTTTTATTSALTASGAVRWWQLGKITWPCSKSQRQRRNVEADPYGYQITEVQEKQHKRASSMSSSENYSSSRSDSWRQNHSCGIPLRMLDPKRRSSSWLITRKTSSDSNHSSSRNDSSGSGTTASTSTWRMSRSSGSLDMSLRSNRSKPRLTRQMAFQEPDSPGSPGRLAVRLLATIPSAAEMSEQCDEESAALAQPQDDEDQSKDDDKDS